MDNHELIALEIEQDNIATKLLTKDCLDFKIDKENSLAVIKRIQELNKLVIQSFEF